MIRKGLGLEERAVTTLGPLPPVGQSVAEPDGYGLPGLGGWSQGMVWRPTLGFGSVSTDSAMQISAVFGCLRLLTSAVSMLPLDTFIRDGGIRRPFRPRPEYLNFQPPQDSKMSYLGQVMLSWLCEGDAFVATPRDALGVPLDLVPLDPGMVEDVWRVGGRKRFRVLGKEFDEFDIMHIPGLGPMPGQLRGLAPLRYAREVIDGGRKAQEYGRSFFNNGAVPPAVIEMPAGPNDIKADQARAERIAETWHATHGGTSNAGKVGVLIGGAKLNTIAISPEDAEWLESKRFGVSEIARFFGVPPHLIADASNSTSWGSGLSEQNLAFGQFSVQFWTERFEEGHGRLLTTHGQPDVFVRLNLDAKLRAAPKDRFEVYASATEHDEMTVNEVRALEDLPPVSWGDQQPSLSKQPSSGGFA